MKFVHWKDTPMPAGERNDCTVRALALTTGAPYEAARAHLAAFGRRKNRGTAWWRFVVWFEGKTLNGYRLKELALPKKTDHQDRHPLRQQCTTWRTVGQFAAAHPRGRYILRVAGHAIPLIDGVVTDWKEGKARRLLGVTQVIAPFAIAMVGDKPTTNAQQQELPF